MTWIPIPYILFDPETRELLGGYFQEVILPDHQHHIVVTREVQLLWPMYMLNEDMTDVIKNPIYFPPEDPPVDPEPEPPVQSDRPTNP